jgi:hypothetical protein
LAGVLFSSIRPKPAVPVEAMELNRHREQTSADGTPPSTLQNRGGRRRLSSKGS